jgi:hypothetical protein
LNQPAAISTVGRARRPGPQRRVETTLDLPTTPCKAEAAELETTNEEISAGSKPMISKDWRATLVAHPMDQTHSAKLARQVDLSPGSDDGLVPQPKKHGMPSSRSESSSAALLSQR